MVVDDLQRDADETRDNSWQFQGIFMHKACVHWYTVSSSPVNKIYK